MNTASVYTQKELYGTTRYLLGSLVDSQSTQSGNHSIMMEKLAQPGEAEGCTPTPIHPNYRHVQSCGVCSS
jgi:hypothetical protein